MSVEPTDTVPCPRCGAQNPADAHKCPRCGLALVGAVADPPRPPAVVAPPPAPRRGFRLKSLMLLIGLIAMLLGLAKAAPGLAILLGIPAAVGLLRAISVTGPEDSWLEWLAIFVLSVVAVMVAGIAGLVAFFVTCLATAGSDMLHGPKGGWPITVAAVAGLAVALGLAILMVRRVRLRKDRPVKGDMIFTPPDDAPPARPAG